MTKPKPVIPDATLVVAYDTHSDRFLLHPGTTREACREFRQLMAYASGYAQQQTGVVLHADGWVMNHGHTAMTDPNALRPKYDELRNAVIANGQMKRLDLGGGIFSSGGPRPTTILDPDTVIRQMAYCMMQPVRHGLVAGLVDQGVFYCTRVADIGRTQTIERPRCLDTKDGVSAYPAQVQLLYSMPAGWEGREREFRRELARLCQRHVTEARSEREADGVPEPTLAATLQTDPESRPNRPRRLSDEFDFQPRVAGGSPKLREAFINDIFVFEQRYARARTAFRHGRRQTRFPYGTYQLRLQLGVRVARAVD